MKKSNRRNILLLFILFSVWRVALFFIASLSNQLLIYRPSFVGPELLEKSFLPHWLTGFANFDGVHYLFIIQEGYDNIGLIQAFFPGFPIIIRLTSLVFSVFLNGTVSQLGIIILSGVVFSTVACFLFFTLFFHSLKQDVGRLKAFQSVCLFLCFPTAFFLVSFYTESLFLLLLVCIFYAARRQFWPIVSIALIGLTATRIVGVFAVPAVLLELYLQHIRKNPTDRSNQLRPTFWIQFARDNSVAIFFILVGMLGIISYMLYLQLEFQDPLYFFSVQSEFGAGREERIIFLPQIFFRYGKMLATVRPFDLKYFTIFQELLITVVVGITLLIPFFNSKIKAHRPELFFSICSFLLPTITGTFSSMPRYALVCLSFFVILPQLFKKNILFYLLLAVSFVMLILNTILFIQGYWVA